MSNSTLFDRLNHELEAFGRKAQAALDEGKLQIELMRVSEAAGQRRPGSRAPGLSAGAGWRSRAAPGRRAVPALDDLVADVTRLEGLVDARRKPEPAASPVTSSVTN